MLRLVSILSALAVLGISSVAAATLCGNGVLDANEQCDDGNATANDGCDLCVVESNFSCNNTSSSNRVQNAGFENGSQDWSTDLILSSGQAQDGEISVVSLPNSYITNACLSGMCAEVNGGGSVWRQTISVTVGQTYTFGAYLAVREDGGATARVTLQADGQDITAEFAGAAANPAPWTFFSGTFVATASTVELSIYNAYLGGTGNGWAIDEISLTSGPSACFCVPQCNGVACGDDMCGGSCGSCPSGRSCSAGACVVACVPQCSGLECGDDTCGGSCGTCGEGQTCVTGQCEAVSEDMGIEDMGIEDMSPEDMSPEDMSPEDMSPEDMSIVDMEIPDMPQDMPIDELPDMSANNSTGNNQTNNENPEPMPMPIPMPTTDDGCGCGTTSSNASVLLLLLAFFAFMRRRRVA